MFLIAYPIFIPIVTNSNCSASLEEFCLLLFISGIIFSIIFAIEDHYYISIIIAVISIFILFLGII